MNDGGFSSPPTTQSIRFEDDGTEETISKMRSEEAVILSPLVVDEGIPFLFLLLKPSHSLLLLYFPPISFI